MGGNALSFETRRIKKAEFERLSSVVSSFLSSKNVKHRVIESYSSKETFGDIDVIVVFDQDRRSLINDGFAPSEIFRNSDVYSFDLEGVQVDFIFTQDEFFETSVEYMRFSDLGNLIGRIYHKMGLKFGHDGLTLTVRDDTHVIAEISLSKNIDEILEIAGYDPVRYHQGFDTLEDIFNFVVSSPYYTYSIFDLDNRNYRARTRDRKRKTYTEFLKWAEERPGTYVYSGNKADYLPRILHRFDKIDEYMAILKKYSRYLSVKEKFNGSIVMQITGIRGKELGAFVTLFRNIFSDSDLLRMTPDMIKFEIENLSRSWTYVSD